MWRATSAAAAAAAWAGVSDEAVHLRSKHRFPLRGICWPAPGARSWSQPVLRLPSRRS